MMSIDGIWRAKNQQALFRKLLNAMSRPGTIEDLSEELEKSPAFLGVMASLMDGTQSYADLAGMVSEKHQKYLEAEVSPSETADFLLVGGGENPASINPKCGTLENPETSATFILNVKSLGQGPLGLVLTGPGIKDSCALSLNGLSLAWLEARESWNKFFPLGVDFILVDETNICALPRTTRIELKEAACLT